MNSALQEIFRQLNEQREAIQALQAENKGLIAANQQGGKQRFPSQWKAGIIQYPGCFAFPMSVEIEMQSKGNTPFGTAVEESTGSMKFDISDPCYLTNITASLVKTNGTIGEDPAIPDPGIGYFRPLSMDCCSPLSPVEGQPAYHYFCDFEFQLWLDAKQLVITYGWLPSTLLQTDRKKGFILPIEYKVKHNETLHVKAQPLRAVQKIGDGFNLKFQAHFYKMLPSPKKIIDAMNQAEDLEL